MKYVEQMKDTEIVWHNGKELDTFGGNLIVYSVNEYGNASFLAGGSLIDEDTHVASIYSKLMSVNAITAIPTPIRYEWKLYLRENTFILKISNNFPIEPSLDDNANRNAWLYTYPVIRDVVLSLDDFAVKDMLFLTSDTLERYSSRVDVLKAGEYAEYEWNGSELYAVTTDAKERELEEDIFLVPISWVFAEMFEAFSDEGKSTLLICQGANCAVDEVSAETMLSRVKERYGLDYDEDEYFRLRDLLLSAQTLQEALGDWE